MGSRLIQKERSGVGNFKKGVGTNVTEQQAMEKAFSIAESVKLDKEIAEGKADLIEPEFGIWRGDEIYKHSSGIEVPVIEGLINQGDIVCFQAEGGIGKSVVLLQMLFNLTTAKSFLEMLNITKKHKVLWNMGESLKRKHVRRLNDMKKALEIDDKLWYFNNCNKMFLNHQESFDMFVERITEPNIKYDIIIFDPLYQFYLGDFNDVDKTKQFTANVREIQGMFPDSTIIFAHHSNKDQYFEGKKIKNNKMLTGSMMWQAFFTTIYNIEKHGGYHYINSNKDRDGDAIQSIKMKMIVPQDPNNHEEKLYFTTNIEEVEKEMEIGTNEFLLLKLLREKSPRKPKEFYYEKDKVAGKLSRSTFYKLINVLEANGTVRKEKGLIYLNFGNDKELTVRQDIGYND